MDPMLCEPSEIFDSLDYSWEIKWDGERALLYLNSGKLTIQNRKGKDVTFRYPELQEISGNSGENKYSDGRVKRIVDAELGKTAILDGEIIVYRDEKSDFELLAQRSHLEKRFDIELRSSVIPVTFMAFDILSLENQDLTQEPLEKRRIILFNEFPETKTFRWSKPLAGRGPDLFKMVQQRNLEGLIAKRNDSPYVSRRSPYWKKVKYEKTEDVRVTGYSVNNAGIRLENETGFGVQCSGAQSVGVKEIIDKEGFAIVEVKYLNKTRNGKFRMPTFKGVKS